MTLVVGVNFGGYALFAADARETLYDPHSNTVTLNEAFAKIRRWPRGLATGSGVTRAVFGAIDDWSAYDASILRPDEISRYLTEFVPAFAGAASKHVSNPTMVPQLAKAGWVLSDASDGTMRVRFYHTDLSYAAIEPPKCFPVTLLPIDLSAEISTPFETKLRDEFKPCDDPSRVAGSIEQALPPLIRFFDEMTERSVHLGSGFQVGAHTVDGRIDIQPIRARSYYRNGGQPKLAFESLR